ncbi:hypothetical protein SAMN05720471_13019 [Fibrobacter sp. UWP2]|nr:hypothetical protein SAMN05720471_13019 [Fibrobacter sp. UWP2]
MLTQVSISIFCWKGTADPDLRQGDILVPTVMLTQVSISIFCWKGTADPDLRQGDFTGSHADAGQHQHLLLERNC